MNCSPCTFFWLALLPSQLWTWPSMMKISSPDSVMNMPCSLLERHGFFHVAEQHHGVLVQHDHAAVVRGGGDLEQVRRHLAAQRLGDLVHLELDAALAVDADH